MPNFLFLNIYIENNQVYATAPAPIYIYTHVFFHFNLKSEITFSVSGKNFGHNRVEILIDFPSPTDYMLASF